MTKLRKKLFVVLDELKTQSIKTPSREMSIAVTNAEQALVWLDKAIELYFTDRD